MDLVQNDAVVVGELLGVVDKVIKEDPNGNEGDSGLAGDTGIGSNVVPNQLSQLGVQLAGDLGGYIDAGDSSGLSADDLLFSLKVVKKKDGKLGALAASCGSCDYEALVIKVGLDYLLFMRVYWEVLEVHCYFGVIFCLDLRPIFERILIINLTKILIID